MQELKNKVIALRIEIDKLANDVNSRFIDYGNVKLAHTSVKLAKAWLGELLAKLGSETPYTPADSVFTIPPTADVSNEAPKLYKSQLDCINACGSRLIELIEEVGNVEGVFYESYFTRCKAHLIEAKFLLGFELAEMRIDNGNVVSDIRDYGKK